VRRVVTTALGGGAEFDLIRRFLSRGGAALPRNVLVGPGDDCAVIEGDPIALSLDLAIEDVHFRRAWLEPEEIGRRTTAAALSDLAAVAAEPIGALAALAVAAADAGDYAVRVMDGVRAAADAAGAALLGGDLSRSPGPLVLDVAVVGSVAEPVLRSGARPGDAVWVTGRLGGAAAAVRRWAEGALPSAEARRAFADPRPKLKEARWLAGRGVLHALIDISDGLAGDAAHIAAASDVRIVLDAQAIPVHPGADADATERGLALALHGGEDYELLFAAPPGSVEPLVAAFADAFGSPLSRVGEVAAGGGVVLRREGGNEEEVGGGYDHFRAAGS
jgi:thiamine-monophosphate kinase